MEKKFPRYAYGHFLLWSIFSSLGMTVSTFIDAVLVGNIVGTNGLAAVNIATPVFMIYTLIGITIGFGSNVLIGQKLGSSQIDDANRIFGTALFTALAVGLILLLSGAFFCEPIVSLLGAKGELFGLAKDYIFIVLIFAPVFIVYQIIAASVRTDANPKLVTISAAVIILTDLSLDLVFMLKLGMGTFGAALSLCIADVLGIAVLLIHFAGKRALLSFRKLKFEGKYIKKIIWNGFGIGSAFVFQAIVMVVFNLLLVNDKSGNGVLNVAFFGLVYTMSTIPQAVFDGSANALSPVVSIFAGEKDSQGILDTRKLAIITTAVLGLVISIVFFIFAGQIIQFFGFSEAVASGIEVKAFRLYSLSIALCGINSIALAFWQAVGRSKLAGIMSVYRNFALMIRAGLFLIPGQGIMGLALAYVVSELVCLVVTIIIGLRGGSKKRVLSKYSSVNRTFEKVYMIKPESVEQISTDLAGVCDEWEIAFKESYLINLISEEIILNIAKLGLHDKKKKRYIAIKLIDSGDEYIIRIRDNIHAYNPFESDGDDVDNAVINAIKTKTKYHEYQRKLTFNYMYFIMNGGN